MTASSPLASRPHLGRLKRQQQQQPAQCLQLLHATISPTINTFRRITSDRPPGRTRRIQPVYAQACHFFRTVLARVLLKRPPHFSSEYILRGRPHVI